MIRDIPVLCLCILHLAMPRKKLLYLPHFQVFWLVVYLSAFALGSFFGCALRSAYRHTKGQQLKNIRSGFALGVRALGIATVLSVSGVGLFIISVSTALQVDTPQQFGQKMVNLCGDRFRIDRGESVTTFSECYHDLAVIIPDHDKRFR
ncbi:unnamed protein product [Acanthocheilonema viteae]|uniref:Transmembrane protein 242 n=1 Tax=Acanthocheilonema viteae TaxID=6277 RepID=A0A498SBC3_ACAVI|nr:unnamed protein product [Acanthocheilonema viteae]